MASDRDLKTQKKLKKKRRKELFAYFREITRKEGLFAALGRTLRYAKRRRMKKGRFLPSSAALESQRRADVRGWPRISVCVPAFDPDPKFFAELLASVEKQSYENWELCVVNAGEDKAAVNELLARFEEDERVIVEERANTGISENTNSAARLATGQWLVFLDHDDLLSPDALFEVAQRAVAREQAGFIYSDEALFENDILTPSVGHFKPDYSPQYLLNVNYIAHLAAVKKEIFFKVGGFRSDYDGAQDHDLYLRVLEETGGAEHIRRVLYYWRQHEDSTSTGLEAKPYAAEAAKKAITGHLDRENLRGTVVDGMYPSTYKVNYSIKGLPLVSVIIPSCEHIPDLDRCLQSIYSKTNYRRFEVLVVENNSKTVETFNYYKKAADTYPNLRVLVYDSGKGFNFSAVCNYGRGEALGHYLLFLNNDTEVITPGWMEEMLQLCQLDEVGVVGAMLYYPDDTVQHAGVVVGLGGYAGHSHKYAYKGRSGYMFRQACVQELSAVTGAAMMVKREAFDKVTGFDERFAVAFNDVDLCLRIRERGYSVLFTPYAEGYHYESKSRGDDEEGPNKTRFDGERALLKERYGEKLLKDPYYSPWLTLDREDFSESEVLPESVPIPSGGGGDD
ncbi:glycosyltransferase family 2 protein [Ruminococcaceae bacterium OttesenSCG-928-D13]|nr:glycosyltransferase family 2 protein [Ruminococcaceae bacterium OttesenSCG-928-D13]